MRSRSFHLALAAGFVIAATATSALAGPSRLELKLSEAEASALAFSSQAKAGAAELEAARARADATRAGLWPRLSLDASYRYLTVVPELAVVPGATPVPFGDNHGYSVGPLVSWTLWDSGQVRRSSKSASEVSQAREAELKLTREQILLNTRQAYFRVQLELEQLRLVSDSLKVARSQLADVQARLGVGAASRMDLLSRNKEVLSLKLQLRQVQSELARALRELFAITGVGQGLDPRLTLPVEAPTPLEGEAGPTLLVALDSLDRSAEVFETRQLSPPTTHPLLSIQEHLAEASQQAAGAVAAQAWPRVGLVARSSLEYPNGPLHEQVHQNSVSVLATWSVFEAGRIGAEASEKRAQAQAAEHRREQARIDLEKDWEKARDWLESLRSQRAIHERAVSEAAELARLVYGSYRTGRTSVLEVETANLRALEAKFALARNRAQILTQLAVLESLSAERSK